MGPVAVVVQRRLARRWVTIVAAGILLGLGFGVCLASFTAARRTASAYDRVLVHAKAPDAAVGFGPAGATDARPLLGAVHGVTAQRIYAGYVGTAEDVDPVLTTALIAPAQDRFPLELPTMVAGRLPRPGRADEVFVNTQAARKGDLKVGQRLRFHFVVPTKPNTGEQDVTITGIGTFPGEPVADDSLQLGVFVFTHAFFSTHRDLATYAVSNVDLAPGTDARRDLAPAIAKLGFAIQSIRSQERHAVGEALRPVIIVLVALGIVAFVATVVGATQVVQRNRDSGRADDDRLRTLGMSTGQLRASELTISGVIAAVAVVTALLTMLLASPLAPIGPLHDLDPGRGFGIDLMVAGPGVVLIVATLALLTVVLSTVARRPPRSVAGRGGWLARLPARVTTVTGLSMVLRPDRATERVHSRRAILATIAATAILAFVAVFVSSAVALTETPSRYGFDVDVVALNAYGDQSPVAVQHAFAQREDVDAATSFTSVSLLLDGRAVPGLATTAVKREALPTRLQGRVPRNAWEIAVGRDTLETLGARIGDLVDVRVLNTLNPNARRTVRMRLVGVVTFPPIGQVGTDMPRLGTGALLTHGGLVRAGFDTGNGPEFTAVRLVGGASPRDVIAGTPQGFHDVARSSTVWLTDAKPSELRQLLAAMPYLRGALAVAYAVLLGVIAQALWSLTRANRHDLAVLRVAGCLRRQLDTVAAWQVVPFLVGALVVGVPVGTVVGLSAYRWFARSLAVVDAAPLSWPELLGLLAGVVGAGVVAAIVAIGGARRVRTAAALREA
jgi:hypothetical protein